MRLRKLTRFFSFSNFPRHDRVITVRFHYVAPSSKRQFQLAIILINILLIFNRIQLEGSRSGGVLNCAMTMYKNEGIRVFFRGIGVNALRGFPQSAALFFGYEMAMKAMTTP